MKIDLTVKDSFLNALLLGKREDASQIIVDLQKKGMPVIDIYEKLVRKALYSIGELWEQGTISIATEHLSSAIVQAIQNELYYNIISVNKSSGTCVIACIENEQHQIGIRMVADIFEMKEWNSYCLGTGVPVVDLIRFLQEVKPGVLALSVTLHFNLPTLEIMIQAIQKVMPDLVILIGGQAFRRGVHADFLNYPNVHYLVDLYELETFLSNQDENVLPR